MQLLTFSEYQAKAETHLQWLCWVFGLTTILIAIAALQFPSPWKAAWLGLTAVIPMYLYAFTGQPQELRILRRLAQNKNDPSCGEAHGLLKKIEREFHGAKIAARLHILWIAILLYGTVCLSFAKPFSAILWVTR